MPDETLITEIENLLAEIVSLGGQNEDSKIVPNLTVQDASPTNLDGWLIVSDDRDGDNILARKVGSVVYSNNDLVNVMFLQGGEAIAFQQGSESANNGMWEIVPSTSTDIFYDKGQVGIGTATPGEALDVAGNITLDADIIHRGDTDTKISFTDDDIEFAAGNLSMLKLTETAQDLITLGPGSGDVDIDFNGDMFLDGSTGNFGVGTASPASTAKLDVQFSVGDIASAHNAIATVIDWTPTVNDAIRAVRGMVLTGKKSGAFDITGTLGLRGVQGQAQNAGSGAVSSAVAFSGIVQNIGTGTITDGFALYAFTPTVAAPNPITNAYGLYLAAQLATGVTTGYGVYQVGASDINYLNGDTGIGLNSPQGQFHAYDAISGFILWEYDGLDATVRTIIPNGTGDVLYRLTAMYVLRDSAAAVASGTTDVSNSASVNLTVGGNTVRLRVNADGSCDVARTAGTDTIKVALVLRWL